MRRAILSKFTKSYKNTYYRSKLLFLFFFFLSIKIIFEQRNCIKRIYINCFENIFVRSEFQIIISIIQQNQNRSTRLFLLAEIAVRGQFQFQPKCLLYAIRHNIAVSQPPSEFSKWPNLWHRNEGCNTLYNRLELFKELADIIIPSSNFCIPILSIYQIMHRLFLNVKKKKNAYRIDEIDKINK